MPCAHSRCPILAGRWRGLAKYKVLQRATISLFVGLESHRVDIPFRARVQMRCGDGQRISNT